MGAPVLFLDGLSGHTSTVDREVALAAALNLVQVIRALRKSNSRLSLNGRTALRDCQITPDLTLQAVLAGRMYQTEWEFLRSLADRSPISAGLEVLLARAAESEFKTPCGRSSEALTWAYLIDTGVVSLDCHETWRASWITGQLTSLIEDGQLFSSEHRVRNASSVEHVREHANWLEALGVDPLPKGQALWESRHTRFRGLRFLERTRKQLLDLSVSGAPYKQAIDALASLSRDSVEWGGVGEIAYRTLVADGEHEQRRDFSSFTDDVDGQTKYFNAHAYFWLGKASGKPAGRIYFRVDVAAKELVVGHVGIKLT